MFKNPNYVYGTHNFNVPVRSNCGEFMVEQLLGYKDIIAFINGTTNESITHGEIAQQAMNLAVSLTQLGVRKGQVVGICSENRLEFFPTVIATICTGAIISPISAAYTKDELENVINISTPSYIFCSPTTFKNHENTFKRRFIKKIIVFGNERKNGTLLYNDLAKSNKDNAVPSDVIKTLSRNVNFDEFQAVDVQGQTDTAVILYSSGTTGLPKGVLLTHFNVLSSLALRIPKPGYRSFLINPWYHAMGIILGNASLMEGRTTVFLPKFEVELFMKTIEKFKIQWVAIVPQMLVALCKSSVQCDMRSVELLHCGAAPLRDDVINTASKKFPNAKIAQGYGMSECTIALTQDANFDVIKIGSSGTVTPGYILKIVDLETRRPLGPNQQGEIFVKGPFVMKGYVGKDRSEDFDDEGFFKTGDIGYYDEDRYFFIVDRLKELIKYKGYQVAPAEVESILLQHEAIKDAGVVGVESATAGEVPLAFVVPQPGARVTEQEVKDFVAQKLSNPKHLRGGVRFIDAIPRNPSGKILRRILKNMTKPKMSKL